MGKQPLQLPDAESDEAAMPDEKDVARADALAETSELLSQLWNAEPVDDAD